MGVTGMLLVNGRVSATGGAGIGAGSGGGSGGSIWLVAGTLAGNGVISANGGAGNQLGGGAGTIYTAYDQASGQLVLDNGAHSGTNTAVAYMSPFDLVIKGGAAAYPSSSYLILSNLVLATGGSLTCLKTQTNLDLAVLRNATIDASGTITVDGQGFIAGVGPGAGLSTNSVGSGAGYGGNGGASSLLPGGPIYGSAEHPVDRGSGGGRGWGQTSSGSEGGGAIRITVGGVLALNGVIRANGNAGLQDDAGGGSGGSVWLTVGALSGMGAIAADGGAGELYGGGGGAGGLLPYTPLSTDLAAWSPPQEPSVPRPARTARSIMPLALCRHRCSPSHPPGRSRRQLAAPRSCSTPR